MEDQRTRKLSSLSLVLGRGGFRGFGEFWWAGCEVLRGVWCVCFAGLKVVSMWASLSASCGVFRWAGIKLWRCCVVLSGGWIQGLVGFLWLIAVLLFVAFVCFSFFFLVGEKIFLDS